MSAMLTLLLAAAVASEHDAERSGWRFRRAVPLAGSPAPILSLALPPEVVARCQDQLQDLRLVGPDGREVPFLVDREAERQAVSSWSGRLVDTRSEKKRKSEWSADLGERRSFDRVELEIPEQDFVKRIQVEVSEDGAAWTVVARDAGIFDRPWDVRIHHTAVQLDRTHEARYVRVTADDQRSRAVTLSGVSVSATRRRERAGWTRPVALEALPGAPGVSRYRLDLPQRHPLERLELDAADPAFARRVVLREARERNGRREEVPLGEAQLYRLRLPDESLTGESLAFDVQRPQGGELLLEVHDGDSPPLRRPRAVASGTALRLLFPVAEAPLVLYYGNAAVRAPVYDIQALRARLAFAPQLGAASLGAEAENPSFAPAPPLPFAPARGAAVEVSRWRSQRPLAVTGREDLYTLTLGGLDLATLRADLGDVRVVDEEGRQVPFVLEPGAAEERLALSVESEAAPEAQARGRRLTRHRLSAASMAGKTVGLPLTAVELVFREEFYARPARLLAPARPGERGGDRVLFSGTLSRGPGRAPGALAGWEPANEPPPQVLSLDGVRRETLALEVDEGDNAPLSLVAARGVVRVPRLAFKAAPGQYRILLGNPEAGPPRYDLAGLRREVLAYSALPLAAGASAPNPFFRRRAADYFVDAPPTLVLWGTLVAAVVALLLLTARILKKPASGAASGDGTPPSA